MLFVNVLALVVLGMVQINNIHLFLVCRFLQGVFSGFYMAIIPIYIDELAPKEIVGSLGVFTQLFVVIGLVVSYGMGLILSKINADPFLYYRVMLSFNGITTIIQSVLMLVDYIPESPYSLIKDGQNDKAKETIGQFIKQKYVE